MRNVVLLVMILAVALPFVGCKPEPPPPPPAPAPPEPTPEQIAGEIRQVIAPLQMLVTDTGSPGVGDKGRGMAAGLNDDVKEQVKAGLQAARAKHQITENGKQALATVTHELEELISEARDQQRWRLTLGAIEAYEVLSPGSTKMNRLKERAQLYILRPNVYVKGFFEDKESKDTYVFLDVEVKPSLEHKQVRVRPGDEFENCRLVDFVGDKKGVRLEYLAIPGMYWEVLGP